MRFFSFVFFILITLPAFTQQTKVSGIVKDAETGEPISFVKVFFKDSKFGTTTDLDGYYSIETYYATDSLVFSSPIYVGQTIVVKLDQSQEINVVLEAQVLEGVLEDVVIRPPDEFPSTTLHKKVIAHKRINNKEKLSAYSYEVYNKMQLDVNNIREKTKELGPLKKMDLIFDYLDSVESGKSYLPILLSENLSDYYFTNNPKKKREVITATKITGIENIQISEMLGDMYLDFNIYDNYISVFRRDFISPVANFARSFYKFYLEDSTYIDKYWCYKLRFVPKRVGDMTFEGEMWIHDSTYAVKSFQATISPWANINFINDFYFKQDFEQVEKEVWMMTSESMLVDFQLMEKAGVYGLYGRKFSSRKNFEINNPKPEEFYDAENTVELLEGANNRSPEYWELLRHQRLSYQEKGIYQMIDSLNNTSFFKAVKGLGYMAATGYYPINKIEIGSAFSLLTFNPVEGMRMGVGMRTSNKFSRRMELGGKLAYGLRDEEFKYGASFRYNVTPKKRGMLTVFYSKDIEQLGLSPTAASVGSTFNTLFRTGPLDKLTFVEKVGFNFEKDIKKDLIFYAGFDWKEFTSLGLANYLKPMINGTLEEIGKIQTSEITTRIRWTKDEEFISGVFDRKTLRSRYPILSLQGVFGVKGLLGSDYNYQKVEFQLEHYQQIGVFGLLRYGVTAGKVFGTVAYPFLKVHEGNQSYWLLTSAFNMLDYFEFVSDQYVGGFVEQHWQGLFFDRIPLIQKLKWRLVTTGRIAYGSISDKHNQEMLIPDFTRRFGNTPYAEATVGIENIFKFVRVDLVWRLTHIDPGMNPLGIRARWSFSF